MRSSFREPTDLWIAWSSASASAKVWRLEAQMMRLAVAPDGLARQPA
jgi:hypothetical protein